LPAAFFLGQILRGKLACGYADTFGSSGRFCNV